MGARTKGLEFLHMKDETRVVTVNGCTVNQRTEVSEHEWKLTLLRNKCSVYDPI